MREIARGKSPEGYSSTSFGSKLAVLTVSKKIHQKQKQE
jgi:hypothetical protein